MKDSTLRKVLFGDTAKFQKPKERTQKLEIPQSKDSDKYRSYIYRKDDGFILTLIEMIEKLDERLKLLETKKQK